MASYLTDLGITCALGSNKQDVLNKLLDVNCPSPLVFNDQLPLEQAQFIGKVVDLELSDSKQSYKLTRNNQLAKLAYQQIEPALTPLFQQYGAERIAIVIGTSTSGSLEAEQARIHLAKQHAFPDNFHYQIQEMNATADYLAQLSGAKGPVYSISTACSSSGKALASADMLLQAELADVVIVGGVDSLARLTTNGFYSLESVSQTICKPFSAERDGINIGEAAALFVMTKTPANVQLIGYGETSDAYHISAPSPDGLRASKAMQQALSMAKLTAEDIDYINLHGTATIKNDEMEAIAVNRIFGMKTPCSSTKHLTGHTLGAAGALELAFCWLLLTSQNSQRKIPANCPDSVFDDKLAPINLSQSQSLNKLRYCMSNSFAFGGNNFSAILGAKDAL